MDYKSAGVDVEAGRHFVERIRTSVEATHARKCWGTRGLAASAACRPGLKSPAVAGTDGVGTKLELAQTAAATTGWGSIWWRCAPTT